MLIFLGFDSKEVFSRVENYYFFKKLFISNSFKIASINGKTKLINNFISLYKPLSLNSDERVLSSSNYSI